MNYRKSIFINLLAVLFVNIHSFGQGCSDAGFCSLGSMRSSQISDTLHSSIAAWQSIGMGEEGVIILTTQLEIKLMPWNNGLISVKAPYAFVSGNLGTTNGAGDLIFGYSHKIIQTDDYHVFFDIGGKISSNKSDKKEANRPLPMSYQTSLGTNDIMIGASIFHEEWHFSLGYQHPFKSLSDFSRPQNKNGFLHSEWIGNKEKEAEEYFESNKFKRGDDLILRIEKRFLTPKKTYFLSALPMYRLQKDEITRNDSLIVEEGNRVTINMNAGLVYKLTENTDLTLSLGFPTLFRKERIDGLTRLFVFTARLEKKFR